MFIHIYNNLILILIIKVYCKINKNILFIFLFSLLNLFYLIFVTDLIYLLHD